MTGWHATADELVAFRDGVIDPVAATSLETHLVSCARCRDELVALAQVAAGVGARQDRMWNAIADVVDRPSRAWHDRSWLRSTVATPDLLLAAVALAIAVVAVPVIVSLSSPRGGVAVLLALAPLAPVLGAVLAFRAAVDPAGELADATPAASMQLVLLRTAVVLVAAVPIGILASALLPVPFTLVIGWILPGLGLCALVLAGARHVDLRVSASVLAATWALAVATAFSRSRDVPLDQALERLWVNQTTTQVVFAAVALGCTAFLVARRTEPKPWSTA